MKLRFTYKDFLLLLGITVAMIIAITTFFYRDTLISIRPSVSKKIQAVNKPAVMLQRSYQALFGK